MARKRVLHCIPNMAGGGAERQLSYLCKGLVERGWAVHVALLAGGPNFKRLSQSGATIHTLPSRGNYDPRIPLRLAVLMRRVNPDLVQTWNPMMDILGGSCASIMRIPWILSENNSALCYPPSAKNYVRRLVGPHCAAIASVCMTGLDYWRPFIGHTTAQYVTPIVPNSEEIEVTTPARTPLKHSKERRIVLFAGRFVPEKNVERLVRALPHVVLRYPVIVYMCGEGPLRSRMQEVVADQGLQELIRFPGYVENLPAWMKAADLFVTISTFEGRPNTILEAMVCKCPIVLSDIPPHHEILDEDSGFFCDPYDETSVAETVERALVDSTEAKRKAARAYAIISKHSMRDFLDQYEEIYSSCMLSKEARRASLSNAASLTS